jgi:hypothetical protein
MIQGYCSQMIIPFQMSVGKQELSQKNYPNFAFKIHPTV